MYTQPVPVYKSPRGGSRMCAYVAAGAVVIFILIFLVVGILIAQALGIIAFFYPRDTSADPYLQAADHQQNYQQFYLQNEVGMPVMDFPPFTLSNDNTRGSGLLYFDSLQILGTVSSWVKSLNFGGSLGTSVLVEKGNVEILNGSLYVAESIKAGHISVPQIDELVHQFEQLTFRFEELSRRLDQITNS